MPRLAHNKPRAAAPPRPPFDPRLRYRVDTAAQFLDQSPCATWVDIRTGRLAVIREGGRTFVPGSEIARRSRIA